MKRTRKTIKAQSSIQEYKNIINKISIQYAADKDVNKFINNNLIRLIELLKEHNIKLNILKENRIPSEEINFAIKNNNSGIIDKLEKYFNTLTIYKDITDQIVSKLNNLRTNIVAARLPESLKTISSNIQLQFNQQNHEKAKKDIRICAEHILKTFAYFNKHEKIIFFINDYQKFIFDPVYEIDLKDVNYHLGNSYMNQAKKEDNYLKAYQYFLKTLELEKTLELNIILARHLNLLWPIDLIVNKFNITDPKKATEYLSIIHTIISKAMIIKYILTPENINLHKDLLTNLCLLVKNIFNNIITNKCYPQNANKTINRILISLKLLGEKLEQDLNERLLELYKCLIFFYGKKRKTNDDENKTLLNCLSYAIKIGSNYYCLCQAKILDKGLYGTKRNILEAKKYFELASNVNYNNLPETKESKQIAAKALNDLGCCYLLGEYTGQIEIKLAQENFNNAIKMDPYCSNAHMNLAKIELEHFDNHPAAIEILTKAYQIKNEPGCLLFLMSILIAMEEVEKALLLTKLLPEKDPNKEYFSTVIEYINGNEEPSIKFLNNLLIHSNAKDNYAYHQITHLVNLIYKNKLKNFIEKNINYELSIVEEAVSLINTVKKILKKINDLKYYNFYQKNQELFDLVSIVEQGIESVKQQKKIESLKETQQQKHKELTNKTNIPSKCKEKKLTSTESTIDDEKKQQLLNLKIKQLLSLANLIEENKELTANFVLKKVFIYFNEMKNAFIPAESMPIGFVEKCLELITLVLNTNHNKIRLIQENLNNINYISEAVYIIVNSNYAVADNTLINLLHHLSNLNIHSSSCDMHLFDKLLDHLFYKIKNCNSKDNQVFKILSVSTKLYLNQELKNIVFDITKPLLINSNNTAILFDLAILHANDPINFPLDLIENIKRLAAILHEKLCLIPKEQFESIGVTYLNKNYMSLWYWQKALTKTQKLFSLKKLQDLKAFIIEELKPQIYISYFQQEVEQFIKNNSEELQQDRKVFTEYFQKTLPIDIVIEKDHKYHPFQVNGPIHFVWHKNDLKLDQKYNFHKALLNLKEKNKWADLVDINYEDWRNKLVTRGKKVEFIQSILK